MSEPVVARKSLFFTALAAVLALSGCSMFDQDDVKAPCPKVSILADAAKLVRFRPGPGRDVTDVETQAELTGYQGSCHYDKTKKMMNVSLAVGIDAARGPAAQGRAANLSYFVAIPTFWPDPKAKVVLPVAIAFPGNATTVHYTDNDVQISIPVPVVKDMAKYEIVLGLQLNEAELEYNRQHRGATIQ